MQSGFSPNFPHMLDEQAIHLGHLIGKCMEEQVRAVEASPEAEQEWIETIRKLAVLRRKFLEECTPGYYNNEGKPMGDREQLNGAGHPGGPVAFFDHLEKWRTSGDFAGLAFG